MGKNQQHKAMQKSRADAADGPETAEEGGFDASFHSAEWHAARIATLTAERPDWEDWKKQQKEKAAKAQLAADEEDRQMQEYRAQLDADRNARLARGTNNAHLMEEGKKSKKKKSDKRSKKTKKEKKSKKKQKRKGGSSDSSSDSDQSSKRRRRRKRRDSSSSNESEERSKQKTRLNNVSGALDSGGDGPVRLSDFLKAN